MKITIELSGYYQRLPLVTQSPISVKQLFANTQGIATELRQSSPDILHSSYGLSFISKQLFFNLIQASKNITALQPATPTLSRYQFNSDGLQLQLLPDDPQIPQDWDIRKSVYVGSYRWQATEVTPQSLQYLINLAHTYWQTLPEIEKIHLFINSPNDDNIELRHPEHPHLYLEVGKSDLLPETHRALIEIGAKKFSMVLNLDTSTLVGNYLLNYLGYRQTHLPDTLSVDIDTSPQHTWIVGFKKSRTQIQDLIKNAQSFLLISSFIIEDEFITNLICEKATSLSNRIWVLTDFSPDTIDLMDISIPNSFENQYQHTLERKRRCLERLLDAGVNIRDGSFHLKTYISEKAAYLGSCNLTRGSLDFNLEAGILCEGTQTHIDLIHRFRQFWHEYCRNQIIPGWNDSSFVLQSVPDFPNKQKYADSTLISHNSYGVHLENELSKQKPSQITIYSRGFYPGDKLQLFLHPGVAKVYLHTYPDCLTTHFFPKVQIIRNQHAKITILDNRVAFVGGVNFDNRCWNNEMYDLMYKTENRSEIQKLRRILSHFNS